MNSSGAMGGPVPSTRRGIFLAAACAGTLILAACEPASRGEVGGDPAPNPEQDLVVAVGQDEFGLELNRHRLGMYPLNAGICETLVRLTPDFRVEPLLATRWEYRGDNTFRFVLRRQVRFHDGQPFSAEAVKYSLDHAVRTGIGHSFLSEGSVTVVNDSTIDVRPARPNLRLVEQLVHPSYSMIAPGTDPSRTPVCTGPFRFREYVRGRHLAVERNDGYWGEKARLSEVTFRFVPDDNTRVLALRSGAVDLAFDVHRSMVSAIEGTSGLEIAEAPPGAVILMYMGVRPTPPHVRLRERAVRRAIGMAIDREALSRQILEGRAAPVSTVNPPVVLGEHAARVGGLPYDPARAASLLDSAGWRPGADGIRVRGGERLALSLITQPGAVDPAISQFVQASLLAVGVEVSIEQLEPGAFTSRLNSGRFDLDIEVPNQNDANPAFLLGLRWYSRSDVANARFMAAGPEFDALIEQALGASEPEEVRRIAADAMHLLVDVEAVAIPLAGIHRIYGLRSEVHGFDPHPSRLNQGWSTLWIGR